MDDLVGTWRLVSAYFLMQSTGDRVDILGANPFGIFILDANGRLITILTSDPRTREMAAGDIATAYKSMISYTGRVSIDGDRAVTQVDGAWDPSWVGTELVRYFSFDGDILSLRTSPLRHPSFSEDDVVGYVNWKKEV